MPSEAIHLAVSGFLFLIASFCVSVALTPPSDADAEAKLYAIAVFFAGMAIVVGVHS